MSRRRRTNKMDPLFLDLVKRGNIADIADGEWKGKIDANSADETGNTPLHYAAGAGHASVVKYLVKEMKAAVNMVNKVGDTPLHRAAWRGSKDCCRFLVENSGELNIKNKDGKRPVDLAHVVDVKSYLQSFDSSFEDHEDEDDEDSDDEE
eukprot:gb/GECH01012141.1/.p1 GENE.gb/GECH01012141.1/~~gb/GECH01012141.1/.p1  ORF type:complete len:150 (+),score=47.62 gb/GECH01012141.1/:1-450(+)